MEEHECVGFSQPPRIRCDLTLGLALPDTADILSSVGGEGAFYRIDGGCMYSVLSIEQRREREAPETHKTPAGTSRFDPIAPSL